MAVEGGGHHGFCDAEWFAHLQQTASRRTVAFDPSLNYRIVGVAHRESCEEHGSLGCWRWSTRRAKEEMNRAASKNSSRRWQFKVDDADVATLVSSNDFARPGIILGTENPACGHAFPDPHLFQAKYVGPNHEREGTSWFLDTDPVASSLTQGKYGDAFRALVQMLDDEYPEDARAIHAALVPLGFSPRFLVVLRDLKLQALAHIRSDRSYHRHATILAAGLAYFDLQMRELPRATWRVVWYEAMGTHQEHIIARLQRWLGWGGAAGGAPVECPECVAVWRTSTRTHPDTSSTVWVSRLQRALVIDGHLSVLLEQQQDLCANCTASQRELASLAAQNDRVTTTARHAALDYIEWSVCHNSSGKNNKC